jgi:tetratricopeptide (TPR) repeat protein
MVTSKDPAEKNPLKLSVGKDFEDAIVCYGKSWTLSTNAKPEEITNPKNYEESKAQALNGAQDTVRLTVRTELIPEAQKETVKTLMTAYIAAEVDKTKKITGQIILANFFNKIFDFENAVIEWRKAVGLASSNPEAVGGLGLALYTVSYGLADPENMARKQEALNYLQYFLEIAPKDNPLVLGIGDAINDLKAQKLKPQKIPVTN